MTPLTHHIIRCIAGGPDDGSMASALQIEIGASLRRPVGDMEFSKSLQDLKSGGLIGEDTDPLTRDKIYFLTESGKRAADRL